MAGPPTDDGQQIHIVIDGLPPNAEEVYTVWIAQNPQSRIAVGTFRAGRRRQARRHRHGAEAAGGVQEHLGHARAADRQEGLVAGLGRQGPDRGPAVLTRRPVGGAYSASALHAAVSPEGERGRGSRPAAHEDWVLHAGAATAAAARAGAAQRPASERSPVRRACLGDAGRVGHRLAPPPTSRRSTRASDHSHTPRTRPPSGRADRVQAWVRRIASTSSTTASSASTARWPTTSPSSTRRASRSACASRRWTSATRA